MTERARQVSIWDAGIVRQAIVDSFWKLDPRIQVKNPVMFIVEVGSLLTTIVFVQELVAARGQPLFTGQVAFWLWFTVLFANFAEAMAEGRGKAQADTLRQTRTETVAHRLGAGDRTEQVPAASLRKGDVVVVRAGEFIPADGEIIEGVASVDESAITGESAPVIRESGGDRSAVTGGTRVISDWIKVRVTADPGHTFLDRMIALVEGAERQKTPNEIALNILLAVLTLVFLLVVVTLEPFACYAGTSIPISVLDRAAGVPDSDDDRRADLGHRHRRHGSSRAAQRAGDVRARRRSRRRRGHAAARQDRHDHAGQPPGDRVPAACRRHRRRAGRRRAARVARRRNAGRALDRRAGEGALRPARPRPGAEPATFVPFTAQTRMSGVNLDGRDIRKGAADAIERYVARARRRRRRPELRAIVDRSRAPAARRSSSPTGRALGVIHLKDIVKGGMRERFDALRAMGIRTVMITGDNPLTAAAIAKEAGVDDFLAEATPEDKMALIKREQAEGKLVAMTGDGTNDAPALAQADVGVAMNTGTTAAKEAGNMVDLDSNPTKLIEIVEIGKQLLMTRGALTTFSIANDVAKYFAIIPAMFILAFPQLGALNVMRLATPESAILSAVIFNAVIIIGADPAGPAGHRLHAARRGGRPAPEPAHLRSRRRDRCRSSASRLIDLVLVAAGLASPSGTMRSTAHALTRCCDRSRTRGPCAPADLHRRGAWRRQDLRDAAGRARAPGARPRRRRRLRRDVRPPRHRRAARRISRWCPGGRSTYRGVTLEEMDVDAIIARKPQVCLVDELAHTTCPAAGTPSATRTCSSCSMPAST